MTAFHEFVEAWDDLFGRYRLRGLRPWAAYRVPVYENEPLISARLIEPARIDARSLAALEGGAGNRKPYVCLALDLKERRASADLRLKTLGYRLESELRFNALTDQRPLTPPPGYTVSIGGFLDPRIFPGYARLTRAVFPRGDYYVRKNRALARAVKEPMLTALIRDPEGRLAACGCLMCGSRFGLLYGGAVLHAHRRKGLMTSLLSVLQLYAAGRGIRRCVLVTANPRILDYGENSRRLLVYRKGASRGLRGRP